MNDERESEYQKTKSGEWRKRKVKNGPFHPTCEKRLNQSERETVEEDSSTRDKRGIFCVHSHISHARTWNKTASRMSTKAVPWLSSSSSSAKKREKKIRQFLVE